MTKVYASILLTHILLLLCPMNYLEEFLLIWNATCQGTGIRFYVFIFQQELMQMSPFALLHTSWNDQILQCLEFKIIIQISCSLISTLTFKISQKNGVGYSSSKYRQRTRMTKFHHKENF
jgi:hypothetical protein